MFKDVDAGEGLEQHVTGRGGTEGRYHAGKRPRVRSTSRNDLDLCEVTAEMTV